MNIGLIAYMLKGSDTVVIDKSQIKNVKDEDFEEVRLIIPESFIREKYERINDPFFNKEDDDYDEGF